MASAKRPINGEVEPSGGLDSDDRLRKVARSVSSPSGDHWTPDSWKAFPLKQDPFDGVPASAMDPVLGRLRRLPPLVDPREVDELRKQLAEVVEGRRFLLQGGDCAERFADCEPATISVKLKILLQMSLIICWGARKPLVRVARMAGQYPKPRSSKTEKVGDRVVTSFRGDCVNDFDPDKREPDPNRLVDAYFHSAATLNYVRALLKGGFADLHHSRHWQLDFVVKKELRQQYEGLVSQLLDSLAFMNATGVEAPGARTVDLFSSHEGLVIPYESALVRDAEPGNGKGRYALSSHFLWIGERTRNLDHAHVEFFRGVENPVGVKVGPTADPAEIVEVCKKLDPSNRPGKVVLITRMGAAAVEEKLPPLIQAVRQADLKVVWQCDPMHGNSETVSSCTNGEDGNGGSEVRVKTRRFEKILQELEASFCIHKEQGGHLGGVHFEMTGEDVTECTGGPQELEDSQLMKRYTTYCDPRLNYAQSMEMAFKIAALLHGPSVGPSSSFDTAVDGQKL